MAGETRAALVAALVIVCAGAIAAFFATQAEKQPSQPLGLMTSLPIYWSQSADIAELASGEGSAGSQQHWVRGVLEERFALVPLDRLAAPDDIRPSAELENVELLLLAQPRALEPAEFAALDSWVRAGGRALIVADPSLTEEFNLPLGDPRRPQPAALLSPIFARWGLEQIYDPEQPSGRREVEEPGVALSVDQAGTFALAGGGLASCTLILRDYAADCVVGKGRVLVLGDAAMLDAERGGAQAKRGLRTLLDKAFSQ